MGEKIIVSKGHDHILSHHRDALSLSLSWNREQFLKIMNMFSNREHIWNHEHFSNLWIILQIFEYFLKSGTFFLNRRTFQESMYIFFGKILDEIILKFTNIFLIYCTIFKIHDHFFWINKIFCKSRTVFELLGYFSVQEHFLNWRNFVQFY